MLDRFGRIAGRIGSVVQERVGDFVEDTFLPEGAKRHLQQAEQAIAHGKFEEALALFDSVDAVKPGLLRVRVLRGIAYMELGRITRAIHYLEGALQQRESVEIYHFLALAYEQQQRLADARNALLAALRSERETTLEFELLLALGRIYMAMGRSDKAVRELRRALRARPADEAALTLLSAALRGLGQLDEAIALLVEHSDQLVHTASRVLLGQLLLKQRAFAQASQQFEEALEREPSSIDALDGAVACAFEQGEDARLTALIDDAKRRGVRSTRLLSIEGRLALRRGEEAAARVCFDEVLGIVPGHVDALVGAGQLALRREDIAEAEQHFARVVNARPEHEEALLGLAQVRLALGDRAGSLRLLEQVQSAEHSVEAFRLQGALAHTAGAPLEAVVYYQEALRQAPEREDIEASITSLLWEITPQLSWPTPGRGGEHVAQLLTSLEALKMHAREEPLLTRTLGDINDVIGAFESPLKVAIMGEFNAGKSTLINAYLGEDVVPMGVLPTTAHLNVIKYGARRVARIILKDRGPREVAYGSVREEIERLGDQIDHFEFLYPHPQLRMVHFVDTPGFNAAEEEHERIATEALGSADAILWLVDSNQALSETQRRVLGKVEGGTEKTLVLLNKVDNLDDADERELLEYLEEGIGSLVYKILPFSALLALQARGEALRESRDPDPERLAEARWGGFSQALEVDLIERTTLLKVAEAWRQLNALSSQVHGMCQGAERRLNLLRDQMAEGKTALLVARQRFIERELPEVAHRLQRQHDVALTSVAREVDDARRPSGGWLSPLTLDSDDVAFLLGLLRDRMDKALERSRLRVEQQIAEPVEAAMQTLEWIARALEPSQARTLFARLERFVAEEHLLHVRLRSDVYERERSHLAGRLAAVEVANVEAARGLGAEDSAEGDRKQWLAGLTGDASERVVASLERWVVEYFDTATRLCDNVRRDIELMQLELRYRVRAAFEFETP